MYGPNIREDFGISVWLSMEGGLEIVSPTENSDNPFAIQMRAHLAERGEGLLGVVFGVPDIEEALDRARGLGYQPSELFGVAETDSWKHQVTALKESVVGEFMNSVFSFGEIEFASGTLQKKHSA
jgi:hypothetical protein